MVPNRVVIGGVHHLGQFSEKAASELNAVISLDNPGRAEDCDPVIHEGSVNGDSCNFPQRHDLEKTGMLVQYRQGVPDWN